MAFGPNGVQTGDVFTLQLRKLAAFGSSVLETTIQDRVTLHREARLLSVNFIAGNQTKGTADPTLCVYSGLNNTTDGKLTDSVSIVADETRYAAVVDPAKRDLKAGTVLTLRAVTDGTADIEKVVAVLEFVALSDRRSLTQEPTKASLDLAAAGMTNTDLVLEATNWGTEGNDISVEVTGTSGTGAGVAISVSGDDVLIEYEPGVSTGGDVETAVNALATTDDIIGVKTSDTMATALNAAVKAEVTCATTNYDSTLAAYTAGAAGNDYYVVFTPGAAETIVVVGKMVLITFQPGTSTRTSIDNLIGTLTGADLVLEVKTNGAETGKFTAADDSITVGLGDTVTGADAEDDLAATNLSGGKDAVQ